MNIIILGAGKVGKTLIKHMSNEDHDIVVIDTNGQKIDDVVNQYDVIGVVGNGGSYDILMEAGVEDADPVTARCGVAVFPPALLAVCHPVSLHLACRVRPAR